MSKLKVYGLQALNNTTKLINLSSGNTVYSPGTVAQFLTVRTDTRTTYSSLSAGNGTTITPLNVTITPKFASSLIIITWMINGEMHHDNVFTIHQNGSIITTAGYQGFNSQSGNNRWSGVASAFYDRNEDSTPSNWVIQYAIPAGNTSTRTYAPAVRSSSGATYTFAFNRTLNGSASDNQESMISTATAMEVIG